MKIKNQDYYDGEFEYEGHTIKYHIGNEFKNMIYRHGQLVKATRYIDFVDVDNAKGSGVFPYYDTIDKITNISKWDALKLYEMMLKGDANGR